MSFCCHISRETSPGQRGEPEHAPSAGPDPSGAQQSIKMKSSSDGSPGADLGCHQSMS